MPTATASVAKLYDSIGQHEVSRLQEHPIELAVTLRAIRTSTGPGPKKIADVGGGPGTYAFPLADDGHQVDLIDLSPGLVEIANAKQNERQAAGSKSLLNSLGVGDALDNSILETGAYDAVLLLGPLYHLLEESERVKAVQNALRLAKPNGNIFVAFVSVAAHLRDLVMREPERIVKEPDFYAKYVSLFPSYRSCISSRGRDTHDPQLQDGRYEKQKEGLGQIQGFHTNASDVRSFLAKNFADSAELVELRSQEGILGGNLDAKLAQSDPRVMQAWADVMYDKYSTGEEYLGCADHLLATLRKK